MKNNIYIYLIMIFLTSFQSCKKDVTVAPPINSLTSTSIYSSSGTATAAVNGIFAQMSNIDFFGSGNFGTASTCSSFFGLSADELQVINGANGRITPIAYTDSFGGLITENLFWSSLYNTIYNANAAIEGLSTTTAVTSPLKEQLIGEAEFVRAFCYFYLVNIYGDVPLITSTNYLVNQSASRTAASDVYKQITNDLLDAKSKLSESYLSPSGKTATERILPNKGAATALLARVYLYLKDYTNAKLQAGEVIANSNYALLSDPNAVFLTNSQEAIWQIQPTVPGYNTPEGYMYTQLIANGGPDGVVAPIWFNDNFVNDFENNDNRLKDWVKKVTSGASVYYVPFKYKLGATASGTPLQEYTMVLRLAEQYLILAEAESALGDQASALQNLNIIRNRAGLPNSPLTPSSAQAQVMAAIFHERQVELFTELGHRWFDLKRSGALDSVMGNPGNVCATKGGVWNTYLKFLPIPNSDIQSDPKLTQNPGY